MKVIIIGSKGFIGQHLINHFQGKNYEVWGADVVVDYVNIENYYFLGELFEKQQDYKNALVYFKKHSELENVILAEKQLAEINELERDFSFAPY